MQYRPISILAAGFILCLLTHDLSGSAGKPNILLIMADDMGYECVGANGGKDYQTPSLDRLAASGIRFTRCHSQPICTPSRVQLMTGLYNSRNYVRFGQLDPEADTFAHYFKDHDYETVIAGKWQLDGGTRAPEHFGFDRWCLWQITARPSRYWGPGLEVDGAAIQYPEDRFGPDVVVDYLCEFMERHAAGSSGPFFAYYPMMLPHDPFVSTPANLDRTQSPGQSKTELFPGFIAYTDSLVGRLVRKLEETGLRENTLVMFVGDNGTHPSITSNLDGKPYRGGKGKLTRNGTHVPFIASWPSRIQAGRVSDALIDFSDFFSTLAEAVGQPFPEDRLTDGISFLPVLTGESEGERAWSYCYYERNGDRDRARQFVHNHRFKLYDTGEFYDLRNDFTEASPIEDRGSDVYEMLRKALEEHMAIAAEASPRIERRRNELPPVTYNRKPHF